MFRSIRSKRSAASRTPTTRQRLRIGYLEDRSLPSVSATLFDGTLVVTGSQTGPAADQIRIAGDVSTGERAFDLVRVFDGMKQVGAFAGVRNISVLPGGNSTLDVDLNGYQGVKTLAIMGVYEGTNIIRLGEGTVSAVTIAGAEGAEVISVNGLSAQTFDADTGAGADHFRFGRGDIGQLAIHSAESVFLEKTVVGTATLDNRGGTMVVQSTAMISNDLQVFTGTGSLTVGGSVGGKVDYVSFGTENLPTHRNAKRLSESAERILPDRAQLLVAGEIGGSLRMTSSDLDDTAVFANGSDVGGSVTLEMGAGNDSVLLGGTIGGGKATSLLVNMSEGQDTFMLLETARVMTPNATVILGEGDDFARVEYGAQFFTLVIYCGNGMDTMDLNGMDKQVVVIDVEGDK